jgi:hypothetical protein
VGIVKTIVAGRQPAQLTLQKFLRHKDWPVEWAEKTGCSFCLT